MTDQDAFIGNIQIESSEDSASNLPKSWMRPSHLGAGETTISANEVRSLRALIRHVASVTGENEFGIAARLSDHFHIANVTRLPMREFDNALRYLAIEAK